MQKASSLLALPPSATRASLARLGAYLPARFACGILLWLACTTALLATTPLYVGPIDLVPGIEDSDYLSVVYDSAKNCYYAVGSQSASVAIIDPSSGLVTGQFVLPDKYMEALALDTSAHLLYVVGNGGNLDIVNTTTGAVTTVALGTLAHGAVACNSTRQECYITNFQDASITIVNGHSGTVTATVTTGSNPAGIAADSPRGLVFVACAGSGSSSPGRVSVIDATAATPSEAGSIAQDGAAAVLLNPSLGRIYISYGASSIGVLVLKYSDLSTIDTLTTDYISSFVLDPTPNSNLVYGATRSGVTTIDSTDTVAKLALPTPQALAIGPSAQIADLQAQVLGLYNAAGNLLRNCPIVASTNALAINPAPGGQSQQPGFLYVLNQPSNSVLVVNQSTSAVVANLTLDGPPGDVAVNPATNRVYVTVPSSGNLFAFDGSDHHQIYAWPVTEYDPTSTSYTSYNPAHLAVDTVHNKIYVLQSSAPYANVVDGAVETAGQDPVNHTAIDQLGDAPSGIAYDPTSNLLYVTTQVLEGDHEAAAIIVRSPTAGAPTATISDPGASDGSGYTAVAFNATTGELYTLGVNPSSGMPEVKATATAGPMQYKVVARISGATAANAGCLTVDAARNRVYVLGTAPSDRLRTIVSDALDPEFNSAAFKPTGLVFDSVSQNLYASGMTPPPFDGTLGIGQVIGVFFDGPDTTPPVVAAVNPADGSTVSAVGLYQGVVQVQDARSDIATVLVSLQNAQGQYWNGTQWVSGPEVFVSAMPPEDGTSNWTYPMPPRRSGFGTGAYTVHVQATDSAGNVQNTTSHFTINAPGSFSFSQAAYTVSEKTGTIDITVTRTGTDGPASVIYHVFDGTAHRFEGVTFDTQGNPISFGDYDLAVEPINPPGADYNNVALRTLQFAAGQAQQTFTLNISTDTIVEGDETVRLLLTDPSPGSEVAGNVSAVLTITDSTPGRVAFDATINLIPGGNINATQMAIDAGTHRLYVSGSNPIDNGYNYTALGRVAVVDTTTNTVQSSFDTDTAADGLAIDSSVGVLYETGQLPENPGVEQLRVFDLSSNRRIAQMPISGGAPVVDPIAHNLYLPKFDGSFQVYLGTDGVLADESLNAQSQNSSPLTGAVIDAKHKKWILPPYDQYNGHLFALDLTTNLETAQNLNYVTVAAAANNSTGTIYILGTDSSQAESLLVLDGGTLSVKTIPLAYPAGTITIDEANNRFYLGAEEQDQGGKAVFRLHAFDGSSNVETGVPVSVPDPNALFTTHVTAFDPGQQTFYILNQQLYAFDLRTGTPTTVYLTAIGGPIAAVHTAGGDKTYVADQSQKLIYVIDGATNSVTKRIPLPEAAGCLAGLDANGKVYYLTLTQPDPSSSNTALILRSVDVATDTLDPTAVTVESPSPYDINGIPFLTLLADNAALKLYTHVPEVLEMEGDPSKTATYGHVLHTSSVFATNLALNSVRHRLYAFTDSVEGTGLNQDFRTQLTVLDGATLASVRSADLGGGAGSGGSITLDPGLDRVAIVNSHKVVNFFDVEASGSGNLRNVIDINEPYNASELGTAAGVVNPVTHHLFVSDAAAEVIFDAGTLQVTPNLCQISDGAFAALNTSTQRLYVSSASTGTVTVLHDLGAELPPLPKPTSLQYSASDLVTGAPWGFTVTENSTVAGLSVSFQASTDLGGHWSTLPGTVSAAGTSWSVTTMGVPAGNVIFRALASAPDVADSPSDPTAAVTVGLSPPPPTGNVVQFGEAEFGGTTGATISVPVLRGSGSTNQVLVPFTIGGTAVAFAPGLKAYDYTIIDPPGGSNTLTFAPGDTQKFITLKLTTEKRPTPTKTILFTLQPPVGNTQLGTPASASVTLVNHLPAALHPPTGLRVTPVNIVAATPLPKKAPYPHSGTRFAASAKETVGRRGSNWNFAVTEVPAAGASNLAVRMQTAFAAVGPWSELTSLSAGRGDAWSGYTQQPPLGPKVFFRAVASADGFPDAAGAPVGPFGVVAGPNLTVSVIASSPHDSGGDTVHEGEVIQYALTIKNVGDADATDAVVSFPIPAHTSYLSQTANNSSSSSIFDRNGRMISAGFFFPALRAGGNYFETLLVTVDEAGAFSASNPSKGYGFEIKSSGITISAPEEGVKAGVNLSAAIATQVNGPISILGSVSYGASATGNAAAPGGELDYSFVCANSAAVPSVNNVIYDHLPLHAVLDTVYASDSNGSSTNQALPNPGPFDSPVAVIYRKSATAPGFDYTGLTNSIVKRYITALVDARVPAAGGPFYDFIAARALIAAQLADAGKPDDVSQFDDAVKQLISAQAVLPAGLRWSVPSIPANGSVIVGYKARLQYDLVSATSTLADGGVYIATGNVVNDQYDFTGTVGGVDFSALYGKPAPPLSSDLRLATAAQQPILLLSKKSLGDSALNDPNTHGSGAQAIAGLGAVTTAVQNQGFDFQLIYSNDGDVDAHNVVIHDVIPEGAALLGYFTQTVNGTTTAPTAEQISFYDARGALLPAPADLSKVRSMDIRLSAVDNLTPLPAHSSGIIQYSLAPTVPAAAAGALPTLIRSYGGYRAELDRSAADQGAYITTVDLQAIVNATPRSVVVKVVAAASFDFRYLKGVFTAKPGDYVPFDFTLNQLGDVAAENTTVLLAIPQGTTLATASPYAPQFTDGTSGGPTVDAVGQSVRLGFGTVPGHQQHAFRVYLQVNGPHLDPALASNGRIFFATDPTVTLSVGSSTASAQVRSHDRTAAKAAVLTSAASQKQTVQVFESKPPVLSITRSAPFLVAQGGYLTYDISFANTGDAVATNVTVGMQVPFFTQFHSADNGCTSQLSGGVSAPALNLLPYTSTERSATQTQETGNGHDIITWHFASLAPGSAGYVRLVVRCRDDFADDCVVDHSLYVVADNAHSAVIAPNPLGTWIAGKDFNTSKWQALSRFCNRLGIPVDAVTQQALTAYLNTLTPDSIVHGVGGLDYLQVGETLIMPLGKEQALVICSKSAGKLISQDGAGVVSNDGGSLISQDGGGVVSNDGGSLIAHGAASSIIVKDVPGLGDKDCAYLLDHALDLQQAGTASIVSSGAGNLISQDGGGFVLLSNHIGGASIAINPTAAGIVSSGAGNAVMPALGFAVGMGVLGENSSGLLNENGSSILGENSTGFKGAEGGAMLSKGGNDLVVGSSGNVLSHNGSAVVSNQGTSLIYNGGDNIVSTNGSNIVSSGAGNIVSSGAGN